MLNNNYAIGLAAENGHIEIVKLLLKNSIVDPTIADNYAIRMASTNQHSEIVKLLFNVKSIKKN